MDVVDWGAGRSVLAGWRELRWLRRSPAYVVAAEAADAAQERAEHELREARRDGR